MYLRKKQFQCKERKPHNKKKEISRLEENLAISEKICVEKVDLVAKQYFGKLMG